MCMIAKQSIRKKEEIEKWYKKLSKKRKCEFKHEREEVMDQNSYKIGDIFIFLEKLKRIIT